MSRNAEKYPPSHFRWHLVWISAAVVVVLTLLAVLKLCNRDGNNGELEARRQLEQFLGASIVDGRAIRFVEVTVYPNDWQLISKCQGLSRIALQSCRLAGDVSPVMHLPRLSSLVIVDCEISLDQVEVFSRISTLREITIVRGNSERHGFAEAISTMSQLEDLEIDRCVMSNPVGEAIGRMGRLRSLWLVECDVPRDSLRAMLESRVLENLALITCGIDDDDLNVVGRCESLKQLYLNGGQITDEGVLSSISRLRRLEHLSLRNVDVGDRGIQVIKDLPRLRSLSTYGTLVTSEERARLMADRELDWEH